MQNLFTKIIPTNNKLQMKNNKSLIKTFLFSLTLLGSVSFIPNEANSEESPVCPDPSETTISSIADGGDATSFFALTEGGFCRGTPDSYGVTVYKMGFCTSNPGNPTGSSVLSGYDPDYSSFSWSYENK